MVEPEETASYKPQAISSGSRMFSNCIPFGLQDEWIKGVNA